MSLTNLCLCALIKDRGSRGEGICTCVNTTIPSRRRRDLEPPSIELMWVELQLVPQPIYIAVCYRPPGMIRDACKQFVCITAGVPQGSILGPLLFLLYKFINDIINTLQTDIHLYADDAVLMCNLNATPNATDVINQDLQQLHTWAQTWYMSFNASKTKYMIISNKYVPQAISHH